MHVGVPVFPFRGGRERGPDGSELEVAKERANEQASERAAERCLHPSARDLAGSHQEPREGDIRRPWAASRVRPVDHDGALWREEHVDRVEVPVDELIAVAEERGEPSGTGDLMETIVEPGQHRRVQGCLVSASSMVRPSMRSMINSEPSALRASTRGAG